jgi:hypothetical protein
MSNFRQLAPAAYLVAALLIVIPLFDVTMSLYPFNPGSSQWRFGAFGLFSNALMLPAAGMLIAVATATLAVHPGLQQFLRIFCWAVAVLLVVGMAFFALDALQARPLVRPDMKLSYFVASGTALAKLALGALGFGLLARGSRVDRSLVTEARTDSSRAFEKRPSGSIAGR